MDGRGGLNSRPFFTLTLLISLLLMALLLASPGGAAGPFSATPLVDMGQETYYGFSGGLYPEVSNELPADHLQAGLERTQQIQPLDVNGLPAEDGHYIFLSIGMSNTRQEFCGGTVGDGVTCSAWSFMGQAAADPAVNHQELVIVNGAGGGYDASAWVSPDAESYLRIKEQILEPLGYSEAQVQVVWLKVANAGAGFRPSLPNENADAYSLLRSMGDIARALQQRYPNIKLVFVSSRIYAGYAANQINPEPHAYESGFSVKWLIQAQIEQMAGGGVHPLAGNLNYDQAAPWLGWAPYLWADGPNPRSDGLTWLPQDYEEDGVHPSTSGELKVGSALLDFFKSSPVSEEWFLSGEVPWWHIYLPLVERSH